MRLIDADALLNDPANISSNEFGDDIVYVEDINNAPTISGWIEITTRPVTPVQDISKTIKMLEIEKECVLRQDTPQCTRECSFCDLVQNADEVISAYDTAINILKQLLEKLEGT